MTDADEVLCELSSLARLETEPVINVRTRVMRTISAQPRRAALDVMPVAFAGIAVTVAAGVLIALLPTWQMMFEPWIAYLPR